MLEEEHDQTILNLVPPSKWWSVTGFLELGPSLGKFLDLACLRRAALNDVKLNTPGVCPFPYVLNSNPEAAFAIFEKELQGRLGVKSKTKNVYSPDSLQGKNTGIN